MQIERLPNDLLDIINSSNGLKLYLNSLLKGRSATPRSWLYEGQSDTEVLRKWMSILETIRDTEHGELIYQFETSQLKKWGPQGKVAPIKELMEIVTEGFSRGKSPMPKIFKTKQWQQAKANVIKRLTSATGYHALTPRSYKAVIDDMSARDTLESNSGWPLFTRRNKPDVIESAIRDAKTKECYKYPAIALFRNYNAKTRIVWMYPMSVNVLEGSFTQPLKQALMNSNDPFFNAWRGYDFVKEAITRDYEQGLFLSASDFSHTDAHFLKWHMLEVFDVIKHCYQEKYWSDLKESMLHVNDIPLIIGPNKWIRGDHGVSSGSNWTNDVETYMDLICEEFFTILGLVSRPSDAIGDDVRHCRTSYLKELAEKLAEWYQKMQFDVNAEKVTNEEDWIKYLQRLTIRGYYVDQTLKGNEKDTNKRLLRGIYSTIRALNSSLNPEKFHSPKLWSKDMFAVRQFMILENTVDHPLFKQFVKFACAGHPYLVEFARKSHKELENAFRQSRLVPGLNPTYNQEKRDKPLYTFASIEIAASL